MRLILLVSSSFPRNFFVLILVCLSSCLSLCIFVSVSLSFSVASRRLFVSIAFSHSSFLCHIRCLSLPPFSPFFNFNHLCIGISFFLPFPAEHDFMCLSIEECRCTYICLCFQPFLPYSLLDPPNSIIRSEALPNVFYALGRWMDRRMVRQIARKKFSLAFFETSAPLRP